MRIDEVLQRIQGEYLEMPGLRLTAAQAQRLWGLERDVCDALLGAMGEEDIGHFFPNSDPKWKGAASKLFLEEAARQVLMRSGRIVNIDATVIAEAPKKDAPAAGGHDHGGGMGGMGGMDF